MNRGAAVQGEKKETLELPLRPNFVHPITRKRLREIRGGGPCTPTSTLPPEADYLGDIRHPQGRGRGEPKPTSSQSLRLSQGQADGEGILEAIVTAKSACPPLIVGVCVGGPRTSQRKTATLALFRRPTGSFNPDPEAQALEMEMMEAANRLNIGPVALGGDTSVLAVHFEIRGCHTAAAPCAIAFSCWPLRIATAQLSGWKDEEITHPSVP